MVIYRFPIKIHIAAQIEIRYYQAANVRGSILRDGESSWSWNIYEYPETLSPTSASGSRAFPGMKPQNRIVNVIPNVRGIRNGWSASGTTYHGSLRTNLNYDAARDRGRERKPGTGPLKF